MERSEQARKFSFPATFWTANTIELFERGAYYAIASFVVVYLKETLGMSPVKATFLNGTILWGMLYFLPILSGTLADKYGFKKSLSLAFVLIALGYFIMGNVQQFWPKIAPSQGAVDYTIPVVVGILLIGMGGSVVKPCISGTVQKTSGKNTALGFGIFYMTINIGSTVGRIISYFVRITRGIPSIFSYVATFFSAIGLLITLFVYKEPQYQDESAPVEKPRTLGDALTGMFTVLANLRFVFFLIVVGFFWSNYVQIYNLIPLFLRFVDKNAAVELYTLVNPVMIVLFQLLITKLSNRWTPLRSIMIGIGVTVVGMLINIVPFLIGSDIFAKQTILGVAIPVGGVFVLISIASMAIGEMFTSPRVFQYIGAIAPKGQEGLYLGYANLPMAIGTIIGAPIGGLLFEKFILQPSAAGAPLQAPLMWSIVALMGVASILGVLLYDRILLKKKEPEPETVAAVAAGKE